MFKSLGPRTVVRIVSVMTLAVASATLQANHSWNGYHWARTDNPFILQVGDNVSSAWDAYLDEAIDDWNSSRVLQLERAAGGAGRPNSCQATPGRIEACSAWWGYNGWLGLATIWISGKHITQATTKVNDAYFSLARYDTPAWRRLVMCQEIAHDFGLDHQDEIFNNPNLGTCMDYTNDPDGGPGGFDDHDRSNEDPNRHDYEEIEIIYEHLDSITTVGQATTMPPAMNAIDWNSPANWGRLMRSTNGGRTQVYEQDFGGGNRVVTFVIWVDADVRGR